MMKKQYLLLLTNIFCIIILKGQNPIVESKKFDNFKILEFSTLCKVWGVMKYYEPKISAGKYDWDKILIKEILKVNKIKSPEEYKLEMDKWVSNYILIDIKSDINLKNYDDFLELTLLDTNLLMSSTIDRLRWITTTTENSFYYSYYPQVQKVRDYFKNEKLYLEITKDVKMEYRLLSLFRFWNIVNYYYPYKEMISESLDSILKKFIPLFINAIDYNSYVKLILKLAYSIEDAHSSVYFPDDIDGGKNIGGINKNIFYPSFNAQFIQDKLIITELFSDSILNDKYRIGDEIIKVNNKTIVDCVREIDENALIPHSNDAFFLTRIFPVILKKPGQTNIVEIKRNDLIFTDTIYTNSNRSIFSYWTSLTKKPSMKILDSSTVYYYPASQDDSTFWLYLNKSDYQNKNFIFDLRSYPKYILDSIVKYFYNDSVAFVKGYFMSSKPGCFVEKNIPLRSFRKNRYSGRIIALVNSNTLSRGEYIVMALQGVKSTIVVGSQTAGADGDVASFPMIGGCAISMSTWGVYYPDGQLTQKKGVKINYEISQTIKGVIEGKDELLDAAKGILKNKINRTDGNEIN